MAQARARIDAGLTRNMKSDQRNDAGLHVLAINYTAVEDHRLLLQDFRSGRSCSPPPHAYAVVIRVHDNKSHPPLREQRS